MRGRGNFRQGGHGGGHGGGGGGGPRPQSSGNQPMNRNHVFDSIGPDMRMRGTAQQLFEKYLQLGRDATGSGDRVMAEGYFQHAEHYFRILNAMNQAQQQQGGGAPGPQHGGRRYQGSDNQQDGYAEGEGDGQANGYDGQPMDGEARETVQ